MEKTKLLELVSEMTLEEKAMQMTQLVPDMLYHLAPANLTGPTRQWHFTDRQLQCAGSVLGKSGAAYLKKLQADYLKDARLPIPLLFMADVIHGYETILPIPLAQGCSFDPELVEENAAAVAREAAAAGLHVTFSPMADLVRDPRWGRVMESCGEDPYLNGQMAAATVRGYQGKDPGEKGKIAACVKHFAAYGQPEGGRDYNTVDMSRGMLRDFYLPAYREAVQAGAAMVMTSFNTVERVPSTCSRLLLDRILRREWDFQGVVISDYSAVEELMNHSVAADALEAGEKSLHAGMDIEMMSGVYAASLQNLLEQGRITQEEIDTCVIRILELKNRLGLFENPCKDADEEQEQRLCGCKEHLELTRKLALESMVLLKNENGILPLDKASVKTIGVIGPNANNRKALVGNYEGTASRYWTISEGIQEYAGNDIRVMFSEGCHLYHDKVEGLAERHDRLAEVKGVCQCSDAVVVCMGLDAGLEGEQGDANNEYGSGDKPNLNLPGLQQDILEAVYASGKPTILVLLSGSALAVNWADEHIPAILQGWYPGAEGGRAIAEILFGERCPEGKLPVTFYRSCEELPDFEDYNMKGRTYRYMTGEALYPFGYGLSYTRFAYGKAEADSYQVTEKGVTIRVAVKNTGSMAGGETVQAYVKIERDGTPNAQLKGICKLHLAPGEEKEAVLYLPAEAFGLYDEDGKFQIAEGTASVFIGGQAPDSRSEKLTGYRVEKLEFSVLGVK